MATITCPKCGFVQAGREECARCGLVFSKWGSHHAAAPPEAQPPAPAAAAAPARSRVEVLLAAAAVGLIVLAGAIFLLSRAPGGTSREAPSPGPISEPAPVPTTLAGIWTGRVTHAIAGPPPRETTKSVEIESDAQGTILGASVIDEDPIAGAAGAGYRLDSGGARDLDALLARVDEKGSVENFAPDFLRVPAGMAIPQTWRVIEGYWEVAPRGRRAGKPKKPEAVPYLLLESDADDALYQIGETRTGFLSFVFFTRGFFSPRLRDSDQLSAVIDPPPGSRLHSFSRLVWDLSGTTEFLKMRVEATVTGPGGGPDALYLTKKQ